MGMTIYHNPACGTSRNTLEMIRKAGIEPTIVEYLETPPSRDELIALIDAMPISTRELLRKKGTPYDALGLENPDLTDEQLIDAMMAHPILINRPIVVSEKGTNLCRPSEKVMELLPVDIGRFTKEDGEIVSSGKDD
ncbi:arsenate reductase [Cohaesibacter sp. ES.047]|uniref:arsenate reductase (glutaredoxin) n=1 Tax=Cohaesibacter sp. ES.047 TaxID=1798205 RepID=UPI000BBFF40E|nr:arsenate reductase (glutaredoxin) [Cohaesibacter sp. ES.047]SNY90923.1 arsenate reductase [Cohaesibacter sp. ES.047]